MAVSLDHLFIDQDAVPTLVEVKRSSDTRIRREVVGQMLDYAADAVVFWPIQTITHAFERRCERDGLHPEAELAAVIDPDQDAETFWQQVAANLQAGRIRLVFVADEVPRELRRVAEFLNEQMKADVIAIEVKQYVGEGVKTLMPQIIGDTAAAETRKRSGMGSGRQWDDASFFAALEERRGAIPDDAITRRPPIPLELLARDPGALDGLLRTLDWFCETGRTSGRAGG